MISMNILKITLAVFVLSMAPVFASSNKAIDKDGCVKGQTCKCKGCGYVCSSDACKARAACHKDACSKS
jgi:hypothetical protein